MSTTSPNTQATLPAPTKVAAVVGFLVLVEFTSGFSQGFYVPLFGAIAKHLSISDADITWFNTLQTLMAGVCVPILAKLGDIFGHRKMLRICIIIVCLGTLLVAISPSYWLVLVGRVIMGPLAVWLPLEIGIVHNRITGETARKSIGLLISFLTIGAVVGTLAAGGLASVLPSLTLTLLVPTVITAACAVIVFTKVPESTVRTNPKIDVIGFIGLAIFMVALLWELRAAQTGGFASPLSWGSLLLAVIVLVAWVFYERKVEAPAVHVRLLATRALWPAYVVSFLFGMVLFGTQTITTTFLAGNPTTMGYGFGLHPGSIALFTAGNALLAAVGASVFAYLARPLGMRGLMMLATILGAVSFLLLIFFHTSLVVVCISIAIAGFGGGLLLGTLPAAVAEASPADQTGIATGIYNSLKTLGGSAAGAVFGVVLASFVAPGTKFASAAGYQTVWLICTIAFVLCPIALLAMRVAKNRKAQKTELAGKVESTS